MAGRGRKLNQVKNERAHAEWMEGKKFGRKKQVFVPEIHDGITAYCYKGGHWEKV
jgi:hypothetical protein